MPQLSQILSKVSIERNRDETFSYSGNKPDVSEHSDGEVLSVTTRRTSSRPRTQKSLNNSYS